MKIKFEDARLSAIVKEAKEEMDNLRKAKESMTKQEYDARRNKLLNNLLLKSKSLNKTPFKKSHKNNKNSRKILVFNKY